MTTPPNIESVAVRSLKKLKSVQPRISIDQERVGDFAELLMEDSEYQFEPVVAFRNPRTADLILSDGFHRVEAYQIAERHLIPCDVREGDEGDAVWHALFANLKHGAPLLGEELREVVYKAWDHRNRGSLTQQDLAKMLGRSERTIQRYISERKTAKAKTKEAAKSKDKSPQFSAEAMRAIEIIGECLPNAKEAILVGSIKKPEDELIAFSEFDCEQQQRLAPYFFTASLSLKAAINALAKRPTDIDCRVRELIQFTQLRGTGQTFYYHNDSVEVVVNLLTETPDEEVTKPAKAPKVIATQKVTPEGHVEMTRVPDTEEEELL